MKRLDFWSEPFLMKMWTRYSLKGVNYKDEMMGARVKLP